MTENHCFRIVVVMSRIHTRCLEIVEDISPTTKGETKSEQTESRVAQRGEVKIHMKKQSRIRHKTDVCLQAAMHWPIGICRLGGREIIGGRSRIDQCSIRDLLV